MRQKLTITEVLEQRTIGDKNIPLQEFWADGKKYSVFSKSLFPYIKLNAEIDAEVEAKPSPSGEWTNYKITDIFVNGQSVKQQGQGGGYRGKSPEELDLSRRSYALSYAKDLVVADKLEFGDLLATATMFSDWLKSKSLTENPTASAVKETAINKSPPPPSKDTDPGVVIREGGKLLTEFEPITAEQKERLKELQEKSPGRIKELIEEWGWNVKAISKLTKDQANHLIEVMEKEAKDEPSTD